MRLAGSHLLSNSADVYDSWLEEATERRPRWKLLDKLLGRGKQAAGDVTGDASLKHEEGAHQEAEGYAKDRAESAEEVAQDARTEAAEHRAERSDT